LVGLAIRCPASRPHPLARAAGVSRRTGVSPLCAINSQSSCMRRRGVEIRAHSPHVALCAIPRLERAEIIEISSLGWRPRAHPMYHARKRTHIRLSKNMPAQAGALQASCFQDKASPSVPSFPDKRKKGGHFWWPPFLKPDCYSKTVRSPHARYD
jgi:hypothetical protein